jgi:NAD-dependent DNA ligase
MNLSIDVILSNIDSIEKRDDREDVTDYLEAQIIEYNKSAAQGNPLVADGVYDICKALLARLKPDSPILHYVWSEDENDIDIDTDKFLLQYPMKSIETIKSVLDKRFIDFRNKLVINTELLASMKLNGHGVRVVYQDGNLVKAYSRGRSTNGRDLTKQMKLILGDRNDGLSGFDLVELRGEAVLPYQNVDLAREHNPDIKNAFTGVASMLRDSASESETCLLHVVFYDILCDSSTKEFHFLSEKFEFLLSCGFEVPLYGLTSADKTNFEQEMSEALDSLWEDNESYAYYTDGVVVAINSVEMFKLFGEDDKRPIRFGNLALKMGGWEQNSYEGIVKCIKWEYGKTKITPIAVLEDGVLTATGATVVNIPLYAPKYILTLNAYPGNVINFRYGGEAGVIPCTEDGRLVTDL